MNISANARNGRRCGLSRWSDAQWVRNEVNKKWESGKILRYMLVQDDLFPLRLPLKRPKNNEINQNFAEISNWIQDLKRESKSEIGYGYEVEEKPVVNRQSGRNKLPTHAVITTVQDALYLLKKQREADRFLELSRGICSEWPSLSDWIAQYPHKVLESEKDWQSILSVLRWFFDHPRCGLYLRQLDIHGIDTKFIERRKGLLTELLNIILPESSIDPESSTFEVRFGLQAKPALVRFRLLDRVHYIQGMSDFTVPVDQFELWHPPISRIFITENEINGLCFPDMKDGLVIFKLGYGIDVLRKTEWLKTKKIYYWGDIDTHGFAILDEARSFLPQIQSIMMDETTLISHRNLWCTEEKPFLGQLNHLTDNEYRLFCELQGNVWGKGVRLEQERISFSFVQRAIEQIS